MDENQVKKPKWLRQLEKESWQAELIISGIAIFGALQLPDLADQFAESLIGYFSIESNYALSLFFIYSFIAIYILIVSFVLHFVLRALWIGMVGLNSVFPNGINVEGGQWPRYFTQKLKEDVSYDNDIIRSLDDLCSMVFALCANFVLIFLVININVILGFGVWSLLCLFLPVATASAIIKSVISVLLVFSIISFFFNMKPLRDTKFAKRFHYQLFKWSSKPFLHVFYRPVNLLGFTFTTNISLRKYYFWTALFFVLVSFLAISKYVNSKALYFSRDDILELFYDRSDRLQPENYENLRGPHDGKILSAVIENDRISGKSMRVFVPVFRNEKELQTRVCGAFEEPEDVEKNKVRKLQRKFFSECVAAYHRFYVNDSLYIPEIIKYSHPNLDEDGILAYLPTANFKLGSNVLRVEKIESDSSVYRRMLVPFRFEPD